MPTLGVIGSFEMVGDRLFDDHEPEVVVTRWGSVEINSGHIGGRRVVQLTRAGSRHPLPCHAIDFRANIAALVQSGVTDVVATAMVGSLRPSVPIGSLLLLDQFLDFTKNRAGTYYDDEDFAFVDFTEPYCPRLRRELAAAGGAAAEIGLGTSACYVCVDGPRYETRAEVRMYGLLGGDVIGMTLLPETVMAREAGLCYAAVAGVVNLGAGLSDESLSTGVFLRARNRHMEQMVQLIRLFATGHLTDPIQGCACGLPARTQRHSRAQQTSAGDRVLLKPERHAGSRPS
jgi:5'-methylthioadenosine phosphorylase